jgi:hypothetical protein
VNRSDEVYWLANEILDNRVHPIYY